jgi:hypothetical protein
MRHSSAADVHSMVMMPNPMAMMPMMIFVSVCRCYCAEGHSNRCERQKCFLHRGTFRWDGGASILPRLHYNFFQAEVPQCDGSVLTGVQQHPYLLALLASDDTHECCASTAIPYIRVNRES